MEKELNKETLIEDKISRMALGIAIADELLNKDRISIFFDIFGKVQIMDMNGEPPLPIIELNQMSEEDSIETLLKAEISEDRIVEYLKQRPKDSV